MDDLNFIEAVRERDIDLLVLEEFYCSESFLLWFCQRVLGALDEPHILVGAFHAVTHPRLGESDLVLIMDLGEKRVAILIENKIDATTQPEQPGRYRQRGQEGIESGDWKAFRTCMIAPQRYLDSTDDASHYDSQISYETLRDWFRESGGDGGRSDYKARLLGEAIEQNRRGPSSIPHEAVTAFWHRYEKLVESEYPHLKISKRPYRPETSDWPLFPLGAGPKIIHKWKKGYVDLEIAAAGDRIAHLAEMNASLLGEGITVVATGESAAFRIEVPTIDRFGDFAAQEANIREGLDGAVKLLELSTKLVLDLSRG